ncbi:MAG: phosphonate C-P lyase system protein PhnG [Rhizobium sp.]|nr:phosphonate C-P lyase system protein PhnG [Rhizobium sp.]
MTQLQNADMAGPDRRRVMEACAKAERSLLEGHWAGLAAKPAYQAVRGPETGLVMIRGRIGGGGAPFNLGEATVSRATIRLETGEIGFGQTLGLDPRKAELAAIVDALAQRPDHAAEIADLVARIEDDVARADAEEAAQTAATRVDFFAMVRGED